jgi:hypothetical protein
MAGCERCGLAVKKTKYHPCSPLKENTMRLFQRGPIKSFALTCALALCTTLYGMNRPEERKVKMADLEAAYKP